MERCLICDSYGTQQCHVRAKSSFEDGEIHDFHNILYLCERHHYQYFDRGRLAIAADCSSVVLLHCVSYRRVETLKPQRRFYVKREYLDWKNDLCHSYLKAEIRRVSIEKVQPPIV